MLINATRTAVFTSPPDPREPRVSGVGLNHDPDGGLYVVPSSYDARWDDEGYQFPITDQLPMMRQSPWDGRHGFIFHAVCYSILQKFFGSREVPVARLNEVCRSFPFQYLGLSWGHEYGGIVRVDGKNQCPWEDQYLDEVEQPELSHQRADPWNVREVKGLLQGTQLGSQMRRNIKSTTSAPMNGAVMLNHFTRLPVEVLECIMTYLPTNDVRSFVQTSKGLAMVVPSKLGQSFWASRFQQSFELDFVFETQEHRDRLDWRALYFEVMKVMPCSSGLQNRKRIWGLIRSPLSTLLCMDWSDCSALHLGDVNDDQLRWREVCGNLQPLYNRPRAGKFAVGCKRFREQCVFIPNPLRQIVVSTTSIANSTYVTGLRFIPHTGLDVCLGYTAKGNQSFLSTTDQCTDAVSVQGIVLAVGSRGIQALQFITCAGQFSRWLGCPDNLPRTCRLATSKSIAALEAGFDVRTASSIMLPIH